MFHFWKYRVFFCLHLFLMSAIIHDIEEENSRLMKKLKNKASKERSFTAVLRAPKLKTVKDYDNYIKSLQEATEALQIKLVDLSTDIAAMKRKIEVTINERNKKITKKVKEGVEEARGEPQRILEKTQ